MSRSGWAGGLTDDGTGLGKWGFRGSAVRTQGGKWEKCTRAEYSLARLMARKRHMQVPSARPALRLMYDWCAQARSKLVRILNVVTQTIRAAVDRRVSIA